MKRFLILMGVMMTLCLTSVVAQTVGTPVETNGLVIDLGSFTGIVAVISFIITQLGKTVSLLENKWAKILTSVVVGTAITFASWTFELTPFLSGLPWWQTLLCGLMAGLSGCGFYEIIKPLLNLFSKKE